MLPFSTDQQVEMILRHHGATTAEVTAARELGGKPGGYHLVAFEGVLTKGARVARFAVQAIVRPDNRLYILAAEQQPLPANCLLPALPRAALGSPT